MHYPEYFDFLAHQMTGFRKPGVSITTLELILEPEEYGRAIMECSRVFGPKKFKLIKSERFIEARNRVDHYSLTISDKITNVEIRLFVKREDFSMPEMKKPYDLFR